jgi:hypothetical protein
MPRSRATRIALDLLAALCLLGTVALVLAPGARSPLAPLAPALVGVVAFVLARTSAP